MCGFLGVLRLNDDSRSFNNELLAELSQPLRHRGPDSFGVHWEGPCGLAHHRLSVIDCSSAGNQPMSNETEKIWIAHNGEIYNFQDLKKDFALDRNHRFRSRTDTEVILHLYEEIGPDFVKHLNGMYATALWDGRREQLYLARDPYGIKPLFYLQTKDAFWFSSEIKALLEVPGYQRKPSLEALYHYLSFNYISGSLTAFENIHELPPGHMLTLNPAGKEPRIERFFDLKYEINPAITKKEAAHLSLEYLEKAVRRQLISDVPVGVMLSGGVDSSALTALMAKVRGDSNFHTFSIAFEDSSFDESKYSGIVAEHVGTTHHQILVTPEKVENLLPKYLAYIDEPYADGSAIPTYLLSECAKDYVTVLLSGEGGDEFFAGYDTHLAYKMRRLYRKIPPVVRKGIIQKIVNLLPVSHKKLSFDFKAKRFAAGAELDTARSHLAWRVVLDEDAKRKILRDYNLYEDFHPSAEFFSRAFNRCAAADELNRLLYIDFSYHLADDLMIKNDRMTMAHSLEARVPFTDNELVRFLATVPVNYKLPGTKKKYLLRAAMKDYLPKEITAKKKVGLEMPYSSWFRNELREMAEDLFSRSNINATGFFDADKIAALWKEHQTMKVDHGRFFWGLLNYLLWYEIYFTKKNYRSYLTPPRKPRFG